ncbi:MAG: diacylglycerol kinase family protein [Halioglobus sp.]
MSWLRQRAQSFSHAANGVRLLLSEEHHARVHLVATALVLMAAWAFEITRTDWQVLILTVAMVWLAEALNTALEHLSDAAVPHHHPLIGKAKDVAAGAVLITAGFALVMAGLIFVPYLW